MIQGSYVKWSTVLYYTLWIVIVAVSVHDGYLVLLNRRTIAEVERNPLGRWLIAADMGNVRFFLVAKVLGTIVAATVLVLEATTSGMDRLYRFGAGANLACCLPHELLDTNNKPGPMRLTCLLYFSSRLPKKQ